VALDKEHTKGGRKTGKTEKKEGKGEEGRGREEGRRR
jgi:hypothetical protein